MEYIEDWVERALSCFTRERDKQTQPGSANSNENDPDLIFKIDDEKLKEQFERLVSELGLSEEKQQELCEYSREKKIALLQSHNILHPENVQKYIEFLKNLSSVYPKEIDSNHLTQLRELVIALRTQSHSFLDSFLAEDGLSLLLCLLSSSYRTSFALTDPFVLFFLYAFRALLNSPNGRAAVLADGNALVNVCRAIDSNDSKCKIAAVEILSGLCFVPEEGHQHVLKAITEVSLLIGERTRFQHLAQDLHAIFSTERETDRVRTAILGLFNALLRTGPAETCVIFRSHLRFELLMLGVAVANEHIREGSFSPQLEDHLDLFDMMRKEDEITLQGLTPTDSGSSSPIHFETAVGMAEALNARLQNSMAMPHFVSLLQHLFIVPCDERHVPLWRLFDLIVQHLTLQTTVNGMTDIHKPIVNEIDMNEILARLQTHLEYEEVKKGLDAAEEELEKERTRVVELENRLADALDGRGSDSGRSSISSDRSSSPAISTVSASILPPVCPPTAPAPPPPPAIATLGRKPENKEAVRKVPQPKGPLKTLNWTKIPMDQVKGTVWDGIEDEKLYKQLDLSEIEQVFAASSSHSDEAENVLGTISRRNKETSVTVIDPRRFQNCTIMLSKLKMSHREIYHALISMDEKGKIPKDMIEQMLKFLPTTEEIALISDAVMKNGGSPACLALADRYLFEVTHIPRFEQRLRCLHLIRTFRDRVDALVPHIQAVTKASSAVSSNKRLRQYLALVLAIGNYLNYGKRNGNAYGFDVQSLNRLVDVKQSHKSDRNLLHYVIQLIEKKWPDLTKLKRDLASVFDAARFNRAEVLTEMRSLEQAIQIVRNELEKKEIPQEASLTDEGRKEKEKDRLSTVAKHFVSTATVDYGNMEKLMTEMNTKYCECARQLCVDATSPPEELFVPLSKFLTSFSEYHHQLWAENEAEEQVKRQTIARTYFAKKNRRRDKERDFEQLISALQSGDIFKEELCRLRTSFRVPKKA